MNQILTYKDTILDAFGALASFPTLKPLWKSSGLQQRTETKLKEATEKCQVFLKIIPELEPHEVNEVVKDFSKIRPLVSFMKDLTYEEFGLGNQVTTFYQTLDDIIYQLEAAQEHYELKDALAYRRKNRRHKLHDKL